MHLFAFKGTEAKIYIFILILISYHIQIYHCCLHLVCNVASTFSPEVDQLMLPWNQAGSICTWL